MQPTVPQLPNKPKPLYRAISLPVERAADLNDKGDVIGTDENGSLFFWHDGKQRLLSKRPFFLTKAETPYEGEISIRPVALTNDGRITGTIEYVWSGAITTGNDYPFTWEKGKLRRGASHFGRQYDKKGRSVGSEDIGLKTFEQGDGPYGSHTEYSEHLFRNRHAVLYDGHGNVTDLGVLPGTEWSNAFAMNEKRQVVGTSGRRAFVWQNGKMIDLGDLPSAPDMINETYARAINVRGQIVGEANLRPIDGRDSGKTVAFLWQNGKIVDLNSITDLPKGARLQEGVAVNNRGQIVANGDDGKKNCAFLLTPIKP